MDHNSTRLGFNATTSGAFQSTFSSTTSFFPNASTQATNPTCSGQSETFNWILIVFYSLFFIFGLVGNLFALWVFVFLQASRNSVRIFLINCAVADLVLLACLPFRIFYHVNKNQWVLGSVACKTIGNLFYMNMYISITLLGCISLDRFLRLKGKSRARRGLRVRLFGRSWPWGYAVCSGLWALSILGLIPMIATAEDKEFDGKCFQYKQRKDGAKGKAYFNAVLVVMFWLVFITMVVSYARVAAQLLKVSRDKPDLPNSQRYQRTAKKSFFVLFLFTICFAPYHAFRPVYIISQLNETISCDSMTLIDRANEVMLLFSAFNSCLDPVMYFLLSGSVRKTAFRALGLSLGVRLRSLNDATSNSSTMDYRRQSVPFVRKVNDSTPNSSGGNTQRTSLVAAPSGGHI
uniref:Probable G-protein coupled receptor 34 n=1 Tax=Neogobius melanostomus TaxID=47308 RepID=A0A8C6WYJ2_9GOBI